MDLRQAVRIWRARWILTSVLLILAIVGAAGAAAKIPRSYQSTSTVLLLASRAASASNGGNPFLSFSPSLTLTADAVSRELMAPGTVRQLAAQGFTASYAVGLPTYTTSTTGSVLTVTVTGPHAVRVERTLRAVTAQIGTQLAQLQHGVPAHSQVDADTLSITPQATLSVSQTARPLVVVGAVLLVICFGIPIVVDGLLTRRQLRNRSRGVRSRRVSERATGRSAVHDLQDSA
jgi:capsular polysaccharide biosynthesis protein